MTYTWTAKKKQSHALLGSGSPLGFAVHTFPKFGQHIQTYSKETLARLLETYFLKVYLRLRLWLDYLRLTLKRLWLDYSRETLAKLFRLPLEVFSLSLSLSLCLSVCLSVSLT